MKTAQVMNETDFCSSTENQTSKVKRVVKTLNLKDSPESIRLYRKAHDEIWPEIARGISEVGITVMDIYLSGNRAVMIMEYPEELDIDAAMSRLATLPQQDEWEAFVAQFQECNPDDTSAEKWKEMEKVFSLETALSNHNIQLPTDKGQRKKVFVSGCYDMLHSGHVAFFREASQYGDLYVGIGSDDTILELKNRRTVYSEKERLYMVKAVRHVKDAYVNRGHGMMDFVDTVEMVKPDIFIVNSDGGSEEKREFCRQRGIKYIELQRVPEEGLDARSTTSLRKEVKSEIPYRIDIAGTWIDQPYVSQHVPGWAITASIEPTIEFMERGGMSTSTRKAAKTIWRYQLPEGNEEMLSRLLFCFENEPEDTKGHISGAQDAIGICLSGLSRHYYEGNYWPSAIERVHNPDILDWLEQHLSLVAMFPRRAGCSVVKGKDITDEKVKALTSAADDTWRAILDMDLQAFADAYLRSFEAQIAMFPAMMQPGVQEHIDRVKEEGALAWKMTGAGGGGYLLVVHDGMRIPSGSIPVKIRRI